MIQKVYIFEETMSCYVGDSLTDELKAKAVVKEVIIPEGKHPQARMWNGKLDIEFVDFDE
jgi:hypothetical protein